MLKRSKAKWFRVFGSNEIEGEPDSVFGNDFAGEILHSSEPPNWIDVSDKNNYEALKVDKWLKIIPHAHDEMTDSEWDEQDKFENEFIERERKFCDLIQRLQIEFPEFMCYVNVPSRYTHGD